MLKTKTRKRCVRRELGDRREITSKAREEGTGLLGDGDAGRKKTKKKRKN